MPVSITVHAAGKGTCKFSGKACEGYLVSIEKQSPVFLSDQSFKRMMKYKLAENEDSTPQSAVAGGGHLHPEVRP